MWDREDEEEEEGDMAAMHVNSVRE